MTVYAGLYGPEALIEDGARLITAAVIDVFQHGTTTHVSLYQDNARATPLSNPVPGGVDGSTAGRGLDTHGNLSFYVDPGRYDLRIATGIGTRTIQIEVQPDPGEGSAAYSGVIKQRAEAGAFTAIADALAEGIASVGLNILGDSTGLSGGGMPGSTRWPDLILPTLASTYPTYGVQKIDWSDALQAYGLPTVQQAPPNGARYTQTANAGASAQHPGYGATLTTDIDVIVKVSLDDWASANGNTFAARWGGGAASTRQFYFQKKPDTHALTFGWSSDGATQAAAWSSTAVPTYPANGSPLWLRVTLQVNVGGGWTLDFYQSADYNPYDRSGTWTAVGASQHAGSPTTIFADPSAWPYEFAGSTNSGDLTGKTYWIEVRNGVGGPNMVPAVPDAWSSANAPHTHGGSPMLTLVNGSRPGGDIVYLTDATRLPKMTPRDFNTLSFVLSCSHNDTTKRGFSYLASWDSWLSALRSRFPDAPIAVSAQNPKIAPADYIDAHRNRQRELTTWAAKNKLTHLPIYRDFLESTAGLAALIYNDGIHPTDAAGSPLWAQTVAAALAGRV